MLKRLQAEASSLGHGLSLVVSKRNPVAERIYLRHGFCVLAESEKRKAMTWTIDGPGRDSVVKERLDDSGYSGC
jgi:hypothetical protein